MTTFTEDNGQDKDRYFGIERKEAEEKAVEKAKETADETTTVKRSFGRELD